MRYHRLPLALLTLALAVRPAAAQRAAAAPAHFAVRAENPLTITRRDETVTVPWAEVQRRLAGVRPDGVRVIDAEGREITSQVVDDDGDGTMDALIFQADFVGKDVHNFVVEAAAPTRKYEPRVAVRHDDPRDDVAWESDRAAYRIYGEGLKKTSSAMSSSGIDVWVKRTRALIVEKWYTKGHDSYHIDTGEGADFFDVGESLGAGGTAGWYDDTLWRADNFKSWRIIANGPIRASFELRYDPWSVGPTKVSEIKRIAIDAGQNEYRQESIFTTPAGGDVPYVIGVVKRAGMVGIMSKANAWAWLSGWGPVDPKHGGHGELGTAVLLPRTAVTDWKEAHGHYLAVSHAQSGRRVVHYIGSGWTASGHFSGPQSWWRHLDDVAQRLESPIRVSIDPTR
jgi:pectinesterase